MLNTPFAPWPRFEDDEIEAVTAALRSGRVNYWTGDEARAFEREYAAHTRVGTACGMVNNQPITFELL